jgi:hypothetical protein
MITNVLIGIAFVAFLFTIYCRQRMLKDEKRPGYIEDRWYDRRVKRRKP